MNVLNQSNFENNSQLESIGKYAFEQCSFEKISIPENVKKISCSAFYENKNLKSVHFEGKLNQCSIMSCAFSRTPIEVISFESSFINLNKEWCNATRKLNIIIVSTENKRFSYIDDKYILYKSNENEENFDVFLFARRDIESITIPSNIKRITSNSFDGCDQLKKIQFNEDSKLEIIESKAFYQSFLTNITIPDSNR